MFQHIRYAQSIYDEIRMFTLVKTMILVFATEKPLSVCFICTSEQQGIVAFILKKTWFDYSVCGVYMFYQTVFGYYSYYSYISYATLKK